MTCCCSRCFAMYGHLKNKEATPLPKVPRLEHPLWVENGLWYTDNHLS